MYTNCEITDENISLHDCHATKVSCENCILTFYFDEGIWVRSKASNEMVRTKAACVKFYIESEDPFDACVYVFEKKFGMTLRKEWSISKLLTAINQKGYTLEFLYQYKGYRSRVIDCMLWSDKKPYSRECQLYLRIKKAEYCWN